MCLLYSQQDRKEKQYTLFVSNQVATLTTSKCIELMGGVGYSKQYPVEKFYRDCKIGWCSFYVWIQSLGQRGLDKDRRQGKLLFSFGLELYALLAILIHYFCTIHGVSLKLETSEHAQITWIMSQIVTCFYSPVFLPWS